MDNWLDELSSIDIGGGCECAPKHGASLNLIEDFFSKLTRCVPPPHPSLASRNSQNASWPPWNHFNQDPVCSRLVIKLDQAALYYSNFGNDELDWKSRLRY
jgi:hypothetical protein